MSLARTQARFLDDVLSGKPLAGAIEVYRANAAASHREALAAAYPVVHRLVGEEFFTALAARFARAHPSRSGDLHRFGAELAQFLASDPHARGLDYLADVARLEWALALAFHAADPRRVDWGRLADVGEEERDRIRFRLQPAAHLVASAHPIVAIWEANQPQRDGTPERASGADRALVYRDEFAARVRALSALEWKFLTAVAEGNSLEAIASDAELAPQLENQLVQWTRAGVIDDFALSPRP